MEKVLMAFVMVFSVVMAIGIFMVASAADCQSVSPGDSLGDCDGISGGSYPNCNFCSLY